MKSCGIVTDFMQIVSSLILHSFPTLPIQLDRWWIHYPIDPLTV